MINLGPVLDDRTYDQLVELARSRLPTLAPDWTDYNAHDPGIMLMELLAWVAEAQIYSLGRVRTDERLAYARLLGIRPRGPRPAQGLVWPDVADPQSPVTALSQPVVLAADASVRTTKGETPPFHPRYAVLIVPGIVTALVTRLGAGGTLDHTVTNAYGGAAFEPLGSSAGANDVLLLHYACTSDTGIAGVPHAGARLTLGVRADAPPGAPCETASTAAALEVTYIGNGARVPLPVADDSTDGLMRTGVLALDVNGITTPAREFTLELRRPGGFARPPRVLRIALNVVPIVQDEFVDRELHEGTGLPDQTIDLERNVLRFGGTDDAPVKVEVADGGELVAWTATEDLGRHAVGERVYELDSARGRITFGNGINGRVPQVGAQILVSYSVSAGAAGNLPRNRKWIAHGVPGILGSNVDPTMHGRNAPALDDLRRTARRQARDPRALITGADVEGAALALPDLEVVRAWVLSPATRKDTEAGADALTLVVMRRRPTADEPADPPETARWLDAVRHRLQPNMPLGTRLVVTRPRYVRFRIGARLVAARMRNPDTIAESARKALRERLALVAPKPGDRARELGGGVSKQDIVAWLRSVDGVDRVTSVALLSQTGQAIDAVDVRPTGLPSFDLAGSSIVVDRAGGVA